MAHAPDLQPTGLTGKGVMQSPEEWDTRNRVLIETLDALMKQYAPRDASRALDVGCQKGKLTNAWAERTDFDWSGVDPNLDGPMVTAAGAKLDHGYSNKLTFGDAEFDVATLANVYEHIFPEDRVASFREIARVLRPGGVLVGQIPNPYFPIESHSRLPFMGWLPIRAQKAYWKLSPSPWPHDFYTVTMKHLTRDARAGGLEPILVKNFNYPPEVIPQRVRWAARLLERPMRRFPWAWQFVLRKPA